MHTILCAFLLVCLAKSAYSLVIPGFTSGNTCPEGNNCPAVPGSDHVETIVVNTAGSYRFDVSGTFFVADLKLGTSACSANITEVNGICGGNDYVTCLFLNTGTYFLTIDCPSSGCCGAWQVNVTGCTVAPGETAANPIIVPALPYSTSGNTNCHDNDNESGGCVSGASGPDLFYQYTPPTNNTLNFTLTNNGIPPYYGVLLINGVCFAPAGCCVNVTNYAVTPGVPVSIIVDGCCRRGTDYQLQISENLPPPCLQFCGLYPQDTEQCFFGYVDTYNGGCDEASPAFQSLPCGSGICAFSGQYFTGGIWHVDNDWYEFTLTQRRNVTFSLNGELRNRARLFQRGLNGCSDRILLQESIRDSCQLNQWSLELDPATYWIAISPFSPPLNANALRYVLSTTCSPPACETNYCNSPIPVTQGVNFDSTLSSCCATDALPQIYVSGCSGPVHNSSGDLVHFVWLQTPDTVDIIASSPTLDVQIFVTGFCAFDPYSSCVNSRDLLGVGQGESLIGLALPAGFYSFSTSALNTTCGAIRTQILFGPVVPADPTHLVILPQGTNIRLDWQRAYGATHYNVYRDTTFNINTVPANLIGSPTDTTFFDTAVTNTAPLKRFYLIKAAN